MQRLVLFLCILSLFGFNRMQAQYPSKMQPRAQDIVPTADWKAIPNGRVDAKTGTPRALYFVDYGPLSGTPEEMAKSYLRSNSGYLEMKSDLTDLKTQKVVESPMGYHVEMEETFNNVPVYRANTVVTIDRSNSKVVFYMSDYKPGLRIASTTPLLSADAAFEKAVSYLKATGVEKNFSTKRLMIHAEQLPARLSYRVTFPAQQPRGDWEVFVDAITGEIFSVFDMTLYHQPVGEGSANKVDGSGFAWTPDPLTQVQGWYGTTGLTDPGGGCVTDPTTPELDAQRIVLPLRDLTFADGVYKLEGPFVKIMDHESPTVPPVTAVHPDSFRYNREQSGFEDVLVYHHIDKIQRYIQSLGFTNTQNLPIEADPHGVSCDDNSHFVPSTNRLAWGEGGVDDAEDADVVVHEYGHAIQHASNPSWSGGETGALGEGFGDFWARSYGRSVSTFGWFRVFKWDAGTRPDFTGTFWPGRRCDDPRPYPEGGVGGMAIHDAGQLWSTVLMEIWGDIGKTVIDKCVLQSHFLLSGTNKTMRDNAAAVIQANRSLYGGAHLAAMVARFGARNFVNPSQYIPQITHTRLGDSENMNGPYRVVATIVPGVAPIVASEAKVFWGRTGAFTDSVLMTPTGTTNEYAANIPGNGVSATYRYFISVKDSSGAKVTHPTNAPTAFHSFFVGLDTIPPTLVHTKLRDQALIRWPARVKATVTDNIGVDSVWVDFVRMRGTLTGSFGLTTAANNSYENNFPLPSSELQVGDTIAYKIIARDRSTSHNITVSPASGLHSFAIISARGVILVVDDDATTEEKGLAKGDDERTASMKGASSRLIARTLNEVGFVVDTASFATHDTAMYAGYDIVLWSAGSRTTGMFGDVAKRNALISRRNTGGKIWIEGGEVGYVFRKSGASTDLHPNFRRLVLNDSSWLSDVSSSNLVISAPTHPIFTTPNTITGPIPFPSSGAYSRDAMRLLPGNTNTKKLAGWSTYSVQGADTAGMVVYNPVPEPTVGQIVFDMFSFNAITDTTVAKKLIENTAEFLMARPGNAFISAEPSAINFGAVQIGDSITQAIRVKNVGVGSLNVTNITNSSSQISVSPRVFTLASQETIRVNVKFKALIQGNLVDTLRFVSNASTPPTIGVSGRAGLPAVVVAPDSFYFSLPSTNDTTRASLKLKNTGTDTLSYTLDEMSVTLTESMLRSTEQQNTVVLGKDVRPPSSPSHSVLGQGGPDAFGYIWKDSDEPGGPKFAWTDIRPSGVQISAWTGDADDGFAIVPLPFAFSFYGVSYNSIKVVTNGFLSFDVVSTSSAYANVAIPTTAEPNAGVYAWWDDLDLRTAGTVHYYSDVAHNRFIVQYTDAPHFESTGPGVYTFQVILTQTGDIIYQYRSMQQNITSATIGIENATGTIGLQTVFDAAYMHDSLAVLYTNDAVQWLSTNRTTGRVAPRDSQMVEVRIHPRALAAGDYRARLVLSGNIAGVRNIPVVLHSTGPLSVDDLRPMPTEFALSQNYPNPFNPTTVIKYALPKATHVTIGVYNILGQRVATLVDEQKDAGFHQVTLNGSSLASGVYIYRMSADKFETVKKLMLVK
ncbi:MAG: T9SS type A sorting domain-containing protein [Ignavibacteriae bacterium]|nr:T9SS type A sorting domain-containing protein [Ignavibacteriota bacterium]